MALSKITGYRKDHEDHWVADLECGHAQHVRHDPPFFKREWVTTQEGRDSRIGSELNCIRCDEVPTLHLICGLPGSGKTTLAAQLEISLPALRLIPDAWIERMNDDGHNKGKRKLVEELQWEVAQKALKLGLNVVLENGFWSKIERQQYRDQAAKLGAKTKLHFLNVPSEELKRRIHERNQNLTENSFYVDPKLIDVWILEFERPTEEELIFNH